MVKVPRPGTRHGAALRAASRDRIDVSAPPRDLVAAETPDADVIVLSFALTGPAETLTPVESEVATYILAGRSNAEIARLRGTSVRTVANQVANLFRKLGVSSRLELLVKASLLDAAQP
jgi:DNA-binding CsgD family transcriptional regulator